MAFPIVVVLGKLATVLTSVRWIVDLFKKEEIKEMKNWRTTLAGAVGAGVMAAIELYQTGTVTVKTLVTAAIVAFLGYFAKDAGVTGPNK